MIRRKLMGIIKRKKDQGSFFEIPMVKILLGVPHLLDF